MRDGGQLNRKLAKLTGYLVDKHGLPEGFLKMRATRSVHLDADNDRDPRAFCAVREDAPHVIQVALALTALPLGNLFGVLYHEIGHFGAKAFDAKCEPRVDAWCLDFAPELGYRYESVRYIWGPGPDKIAANIQWIDARKLT